MSRESPLPSPAARSDSGDIRWTSAESAATATPAALQAGRPLLFLGLILALVARGCDEIGRRDVQRAEMKSQLARDQFEDEWHNRRNELESQLQAIEEKKDTDSDDREKMTTLRTQLRDFAQQQKNAHSQMEDLWRNQDVKARLVKATCDINAYWRQVFFVFASLVLTVGLLLVSHEARGPEGWAALAMLVILMASVYFGGAAWLPAAH